MFDIIIKNGVVIDGTGNSMQKVDIGIKEGEIVEIGRLDNEKADKIINASGKYITPGFIDVNNHSDTRWRIFADPSLKSLVHQGITTIVGGACGSSLAPLNNTEMIKAIRKWMDISKLNINWVSMKEFLKEVEKISPSVNFGTLVGHGTVRRGLIGDSTRDLHEAEFDTMNQILEKSLQEGALGMSSGLAYSHAKLASKKEMTELNKTVFSKNKIYSTHIREESFAVLDSLTEAIRTAEESGVKLHISHLKIMGEKNWSLMDTALRKIEKAKKSGVDISFDIYPYTSTGSVLYTLLPDWVSKGGRKMLLKRLKESDTRDKLLAEMKESYIDYANIIVSSHSLGKTLTRRVVRDIAKSQNKKVEEIIIDLLISSNGRIMTITKALSEDNIKKAIANPLSIISSNGSGYDVEHKNSGELVHPRDFGSFVKVLCKYALKDKVLSLETAINKMTGKPAEVFGIKKRGILKEGNFADIVIFDPDKLKDNATIEKPYQYPSGIEFVLVNGEAIIENGKYTDQRSGLIIDR
jgi:N-acyl-D-amino-acid deacylase